LHGTDITLVGRNPSYKPAVTYSINHSDVDTSVSESLKKDSLKFFVVRKDIEVIPNFIDPSLYDVNNRELRCNLVEPHQKLVAHVSNFRKVKRVEDVITVFHQINAKIDSKLVLIGEGPERERTEQQAKSLGILDKLIFLGKTNEIERVLCMSDLFLLPSETESFGLAALEAMAAGLPVISSNTGGLPEVNVHNKTGYLADVGDVTAMANYAIDILSDPQKHDALRKGSLARANEFTVESILPRYLDVYERALNLVK
jgi:N-acetyl-alpha-D-glucosaminyl L-malate synthase BshA